MGVFRNKVVVVTGASAGIGRALCQRFALAGAWIAMLDLQQELLDAFAEHLHEHHNTKAQGYVCDISDVDAVNSTINRIIEDFGGIDVLINNAGITQNSGFAETDLKVFRRLMDVNFFGSLYCSKVALPSLLERRGLVITMSSMSGFAPLWRRSGYAASKHALHGLFDCLRVEMAEQGLGVMMVCPGYTATDINKHALSADGSISGSGFSWGGKVASPQDVAEEVFQGARQRKRLLVLSNVDWRARIVARFFPSLFERYLSRQLSSRSHG